jgi:hypothetical protein
VTVVVGLIPELAKVFNTKTRAPYMIPFETVSLREVKEKLAMQGHALYQINRQMLHGNQQDGVVGNNSHDNQQEDDNQEFF